MQTNHVRLQRSHCLHLFRLKLRFFFFCPRRFTDAVRAIGSFAEPECFCKAVACVNTNAGPRRSVICQAAPLFVLLCTFRENKATTSEQSGSGLVLIKGFGHSFTLHGRWRGGKKSRKERRRINEFIGLFYSWCKHSGKQIHAEHEYKTHNDHVWTNAKTISKQIFHNKCSQAVSSHHQLLFLFVRIIYFSTASSY